MGCLLLLVGLYLLFATPYWFAGVLCIVISINMKTDDTPANNVEDCDEDDPVEERQTEE